MAKESQKNFQVVVGAKDHGTDFHWLIFKIGNTGTAIYSENNIAWDVQEFGKQRAANERPIKSFVKRVPGLNNLWIVHTEALTDYYTFDAFVEKGGFDSVIWPIKRCKNLLDRLHSGRGGVNYFASICSTSHLRIQRYSVMLN